MGGRLQWETITWTSTTECIAEFTGPPYKASSLWWWWLWWCWCGKEKVLHQTLQPFQTEGGWCLGRCVPLVSQHPHTHLLELSHLSLVDQRWGRGVVGVVINYPYLEYASIGHHWDHPLVLMASCDSLSRSSCVFLDHMWLRCFHVPYVSCAVSSSPR